MYLHMRKFTFVLLLSLFAHVQAQDSDNHTRLTNLPHMYINTFTGNNITSKTTQVLARMWYVDEEDNVAFYDSLLIRGRGNSTWGLEKKPYRIKFAQKEKFLGKGYANAKKWTLLANHADKSLIRNALASCVGDFCGQKFTPAAKFVDLTLNGNYIGTYQLSDQIDVRPHRVNISEQDFPLTDDSNITGGYLLEVDGFKDYEDGKTGWETPTKQVPIQIHYPDDDEIGSIQFNYIRTWVNRFENRLFASYYKDEVRGYRSLVDSTSLASWCLSSEITANPDCYWSMYFYKERDDEHLYFGPLWDYDIAFDNDTRLEERGKDPERGLMRDVAFSDNNTHHWAHRMWTDPWFTKLIYREYMKIYNAGLEQFLLNKIDSLAGLLQESQELNYQRWRINRRAYHEVVLHSTYEEYISDLKRFVSIRVPALVEALADALPDDVDPYYIVDPDSVSPDFEAKEGWFYTIANIGTRTHFDIKDELETICANSGIDESESQQWQIVPLPLGYYQVLNRMTGLALTDPNEGTPGPTINLVNTPLATDIPDTKDRRQMWQLVRQEGDCFNFVNCYTKHTANLQGGNANNGTNVVSGETSAKNATSNNRRWYITPIDSISKEEDAIQHISNIEYALAYDREGQRLHFGSDNLSDLTFVATVYDQSGRRVLQFQASEEASVASLPRGVYVVSWSHDGRRRSVKFSK